jgi:hypothetical protein
VSIEVIPPIIGKADADPFVMVVWDAKAKKTTVTLGGGFDLNQRLAASSLLEKAIIELQAKP